MVAAPALRQRLIAVSLQALNPFSPVHSGLGSNGEVSSEVDQDHALLAEEVIVEVRLQQGQGFIVSRSPMCWEFRNGYFILEVILGAVIFSLIQIQYV
ncbi:hypothetical protein BDA96_01G308300 [Sorghum bicolor]|uniref:Uncharacterized protein n=2 Tax=Sorghum bicolor TaxID=4558 RepID=A0A921UZ61_SORBI|nr:hypothetical protein BDA96_09G046300 [Sorghum bicolor]KAG0550074.1 hypothetical protein BDA96_01G308300 [Sorghum bicolor]KXG38825.1 hypothetical protein SORBI_3001G284500 [Sorghum bicolor]